MTKLPRAPRPILLLLVYGLFLVIVGVTAMAQSVMVSSKFSTASLNAVVGSDAASVRVFANGYLTSADLSDPPQARVDELNGRLELLVKAGEIVRAEVRSPGGQVLFASGPASSRATGTLSADFQAALDGSIAASLVEPGQQTEATATLDTVSSLREYFPIISNGRVAAVVGIWRDAAPITAELQEIRLSVVGVTLTAGLIAAILLYFIFRSAQGRISRQTIQLVDATRRDRLTGLLNHGAIIQELSGRIDTTREVLSTIGVALIDLDNFRLLNETHGHAAGDEALVAVSGLLRRSMPPGAVIGRTGPDEFLVFTEAQSLAMLEPALGRVRDALADQSLQFEGSERLPITVSVGMCTFPEHGESSMAIVATAAAALAEAKASGGDAVRVAGRSDGQDVSRGFDVLRGLILAVDTKDRYTKRHSEDVARYGTFLAGRLGMDPHTVAAVRMAGLLHDIGKIGIPDVILRKPGPLTEGEYAIVKQHVALGDMIVRDVPDLEVVRSGIRHHHERWDGQGYLQRLAGEDIPLIARILSVGDAFSAMTTTRPYRKAMSVQEALRRLGDASGTQLEERLVAAFIEGIETAADAPLPGAESASSRLWVPDARVA